MATVPEPTAYAHHHVFLSAAHDENARRTRWVVVLTAVMMVGEIIAGYVTGSMAAAPQCRQSHPPSRRLRAPFPPLSIAADKVRARSDR